MLHKSHRLALFPGTTTIEDDSIKIGGQDISALADRFGTPLYVYDRATMDEAARRYKAALRAEYPAPASITYAGKAFFCKGIAEWAGQQGFRVDCTGGAEIATAVAARLPRASIVVHGVNKTDADLQAAASHAGTIVVDSLSELRRIPHFLPQASRPAQDGQSTVNLWLRLRPGTATLTHHAHTQTGQAHSKFGMTPEEIVEAGSIAKSAALPVNGIHFHPARAGNSARGGPGQRDRYGR
jgi:diaminopimelate decarboxylase